MSELMVLKKRYEAVWIEQYEVIWSQFTKSSFCSVPSFEEDDPKIFIHQLMSLSIYHFYNEQRNSKRSLEAKLVATQKNLTDLELQLQQSLPILTNVKKNDPDETMFIEPIPIEKQEKLVQILKKSTSVQDKPTTNPIIIESSNVQQQEQQETSFNLPSSISKTKNKTIEKLINSNEENESDEDDEFQESVSLFSTRINRKANAAFLKPSSSTTNSNLSTSNSVSTNVINNNNNNSSITNDIDKVSPPSIKRKKLNMTDKKTIDASKDPVIGSSVNTTTTTTITVPSTTMTKSGWIKPEERSNPISKLSSRSIGTGLNRKRGQSSLNNTKNTSSSSGERNFTPTFVSNKSSSFKSSHSSSSTSSSSSLAAKKSLKQPTITKMFNDLQQPQASWDFDDCNNDDDGDGNNNTGDGDSTYFKENIPTTSEPRTPQNIKIPKFHQEDIIIPIPPTTTTTTTSTTIIQNPINSPVHEPEAFFTPDTFITTPTSNLEIICIDDDDNDNNKTDENDETLMEEDEDDEELQSIFEKSQQSQHVLSEQVPSPSQSLLEGNKQHVSLIVKARNGQEISIGHDTLEVVANFNKRPREGTPSPTFKYRPDKAVRKKLERAKLPGFVCHECKEYYEARDLSPEETEKLINKCSKHRAKYAPRAATPEDYWRTDFPSTEECIEKGYMNIEVPDPTIDPKIRNKIS